MIGNVDSNGGGKGERMRTVVQPCIKVRSRSVVSGPSACHVQPVSTFPVWEARSQGLVR